MMTVTPSVTLWVKCDECGEAGHWINHDEESAAEHAKSEGWSLSGEGEICPGCSRKRAS